MKVPWRLIAAHARRNWARTLLTVGSVFVAITIFGFLRGIIVGLDSSIADASASRLVSASRLSLFAHLPVRLGQELEPREGVVDVTHWTWFGGIYKDASPEHFWGRFGVDVPSFRTVYGYDLILEDGVWDAWEKNRTGAIVGADLAETEGFKIGDRVRIEGNLFPGILDVEVLGIYRSKVRSFDAKTMFFHWDYMNELSKQNGGRKDVVSTFTMLLQNPDDAGRLSRTIDDDYQSSSHRTWTLTERQFQAQFSSMWGNIPVFFAVLGGIVLIACLMVTSNTMLLNARERIPETGILKSLGFTPRDVSFMALLESVLLCVVGGGLAMALVRSFDGEMVSFIIMGVPVRTVVEGLVIAGSLGLLSGILPATLTHRMTILEAIRRRA